ncbi:uncharacterized protein LOC126721782 [Quercus robur]|uniref:uncharacterized protein LOC126721782 n=1 Tax=Quercus robur TaxID=38942 RepID=UPI002163CB05|nr:uncharacterized protein LOC126721782 [Quercus robur]
MKNSGKPFSKGKFSSSKGDRKEFKKKDGKEFQSPQGIVCYECNGHGHLKKECPNYLRGKGKVFATTLSDSDSSNSDTEGECDSEGNYQAFMTIASVDSKNDLSKLVDELGDLSEDEEVEELEDEDMYQNKGENNLPEAYNSLLEDCGKYAKVANLAMKKMKKVEEEHKGILVQLKEAKCEVKGLKGELVKAYSKIKFLELEIIQANVKVEHISTKKLDNIGLGYTGEGSLSSEPKKEVKFVSAKNEEKLKEVKLEIETLVVVKRTIGAKPKEKGKSLPKNQRGPRVKHLCHHCGAQEHTRPNGFKLHALKKVDSMRGQETSKRRPNGAQAKGDSEGHLIGDVMEILKNISLCFANFTPRFESYVGHTPPFKALTQNTRKEWVKKGTYA